MSSGAGGREIGSGGHCIEIRDVGSFLGGRWML